MISLGRRDARKELGLGFGGGGVMDDSELEEGEACSEHNNDGNSDASTDLDISLSYIDEKLQDVLGHFQKDFEGGLSAENLGAKFGGYGSFLPTYQRSPVWSHIRTPPNVQPHIGPRSPNSSKLEAGRCGSVSSFSVLQSGNLEPASGSAVSLISSKTTSPAVANKEVHMSSVKEHAPRSGSVYRKSTTLADQKMLKVRIRVGSDNLSTQKNAAIYSGLGLDVSPSSSLDGSPSGSEGMSYGSQDSPYQSPIRIIQIMTAFPVPGSILLSPLPTYLIHLKEKEKLYQDSELLPFFPACLDNSGLSNGSNSLKGDGKTKKIKDRSETTAELQSDKNSQGGLDVFPKNMVLDTSACEELVSNTLKLPLLSNSNPVANGANGVVRATNMSMEEYKSAARGRGFSEIMKDEQMGRMNTHEYCLAESIKTTSAGRIRDDKKSSSLDSISAYPRKDGHHKGDKPSNVMKGNLNITKGTEIASSEMIDAPKRKVDQKIAYHEDKGAKSCSGKGASSDRKKKIRINGNTVPAVPKDALAGGYALMTKNNKTSSEDSKPQKKTGRVGVMYSDFFGDIELDREEKQASLIEMGCEDSKDLDVNGEKRTHFSNKALKERPSGKTTDKPVRTQAHSKTTVPLGSVNGPVLDSASTAVAPPATEDNWVCCDKCQKWRLLPLGKNPHDLPEKWQCNMLNWLPGMNRCSFSEEETTSAVMVLNQAPTLVSQNIMQINHSGNISSLTSVGNQLDQNHQINGLHTTSVGGKKKTNKDNPAVLSNFMKKSIPVSVTNVSLNEVNQPVISECDILKPSKSSDLALENHKLQQKEKHKSFDNCSDGGDSWQLKMKDKKDSQEELFRVSKKVKTEGTNLPNGNGCSSSNYQESAWKQKAEDPFSLKDVPLDLRKRDVGEVGKKRRIKETNDGQANAGSLSNTGHVLQDGRILAKEEFSENEYRKDKKPKISRSDAKESSSSKGSGKTEKKSSHRKSRQQGQGARSSISQKSLDGVVKRDSGSQQPSAAATSSSSKVSGSHKTKVNYHETKGSPVESVSSSPLRVLEQSKPKSGYKTPTEKYDLTDAGCSTFGGRQRYSDGEDDGGSDRLGTVKKEKFFYLAHHGSLDRDMSHSSGKAKQQVVPSPDVPTPQITNAGAEYLGQDCQYLNNTSISDRCRDDNVQQENHCHVNGSRPRKSGKGSSSRFKDKNRNLNYDLDNGIVKVSDNVNEQALPHEMKQIDGKSKTEEKFGVRSDESENRYIDKNDSMGPLSSESSKKESKSKFRGYNGTDTKTHGIFGHDDTSSQHNLQPNAEAVSGRGKSPSLPPSGGAHIKTLPHCPLPVSVSHKVSEPNDSNSENPSMALKQIRKVDHANGTRHSSSRDPLSNGHRAGDLDVPSPVKRDSSSQAATKALKEAKDLKHLADRRKNSGSNDSTKFYFEAALKFLHGASLLECGEMIQSMHVYSTTAKLCDFCAHEYEKSKDVAAAALAYKCTEVAYMRVIHSSHASASKDRHELQTALQMAPPGESPSSSASDVDNLNHSTTLDKGPLAKGISSPQVAGTHVIAARNRPNFVRLLNFVQEVNLAMEASRKSRNAFAATNVNLGDTRRAESISLIKTALDFNFQDVEGLLRLVRLALEAISR